jgi:glucose/arabinose dehydrogenase
MYRRFRCTLALLALALLSAGTRRAEAQIPSIQPGPGYNPADFRVTAFATGLNFPESMQQLSDGSILVGVSDPVGGSYFSSQGALLRLVDVDKDGVADGPGTVLFSGLPGEVTAVRQAGALVFATSALAGSERISVLRKGALPSDPLTLEGSINFTFASGWEHTSFTLAVRAMPTQGQYELYFNIGSRANFSATTATVGVSGLISGTANGESIYRVTVQDLGNSVSVSDLTQIAHGLRNAAGIAFHPATGDLYFEDNGIDKPSDRNEPLSADELNRIAAADIGGAVEEFGFPSTYIEYRTGNHIGNLGLDPLIAFQPQPDPFTGSESEGAVEIAFAPPGFPPALRGGLFIGFHGKFSQAGLVNEENPLLFCDPTTGKYFQFIGNDEPNVGHLDGLLATADSLFVADLSSSGTLNKGDHGVIYQIRYMPRFRALPALPRRRSPSPSNPPRPHAH